MARKLERNIVQQNAVWRIGNRMAWSTPCTIYPTSPGLDTENKEGNQGVRNIGKKAREEHCAAEHSVKKRKQNAKSLKVKNMMYKRRRGNVLRKKHYFIDVEKYQPSRDVQVLDWGYTRVIVRPC